MNVSKKIVAVCPYVEKDGLQHEMSAFKAWETVGGTCVEHKLPKRIFHHFLYRCMLPCLTQNKYEARLKFLSGYKLFFQAYPDYIGYEIVPLFWDCWPECQGRVKRFLRENRVKVAIFTSSQVAKMMQKEFPTMKILTITEGINPNVYTGGKELLDRTIDLIEFGRKTNHICEIKLPSHRVHVYSKNGEKLFASNTDFYQALGNSKITLAFPRSITHPEIAGNIETLTQRYWENMLSRIIMVGKAPKELINLIGYNPVINIDPTNPSEQIVGILNEISSYQSLVNKNRETALKMASWTTRMLEIQKYLTLNGYSI